MAQFIKQYFLWLIGALCLVFILPACISKTFSWQYDSQNETAAVEASVAPAPLPPPPPPELNKELYDKRMIALANYASTTSTTTKRIWPAKNPYPNYGALLPFNRIIAFYGNYYAKGMGVLGEYPRAEMVAKLRAKVKEWEIADPTTPVIPAIHYIDVTAQESAGADRKYRARMSDTQIDYSLELAKEVGGIVFVDIQVALSTLPQELPLLEKYLSMPNVHLGIDPEFSMKTGAKPGTVVGTYDATDINYAINYLSKLVKEHDLPPKILIVHRYTQPMVTNYQNIMPTPEVQVVMDMDGWGDPAKKIGTYTRVIFPEPVQFTGFKLFFKNDLWAPSTRMLSPTELLKLRPIPSYIQYQ